MEEPDRIHKTSISLLTHDGDPDYDAIETPESGPTRTQPPNPNPTSPVGWRRDRSGDFILGLPRQGRFTFARRNKPDWVRVTARLSRYEDTVRSAPQARSWFDGQMQAEFPNRAA